MSISTFAQEIRAAQIAHRLYQGMQDVQPDWLDEQLLRPGQVAALFQVSRRTIGDWARAGKLDAIITPGGHRRFRSSDVRALLEAQQVLSGSSRSADEEPRSRVAPTSERNRETRAAAIGHGDRWTSPTMFPSGSPNTANVASPSIGDGVGGT